MKKRRLNIPGHAFPSIMVALTSVGPAAFAANQYFTDAGGPLAWDTTTANWGAATAGPYSSVWTSGNTAVFEGTAGTVNVGSGASSPTVGGITFNITGYTLSGGTINFGTAGGTVQNGNASSISWTINSVIAGGGASAVMTFDGVKAGSSMTLGGSNTYAATNTIIQRLSGGLSFNSLANSGTASSFGTSGTVSLGGASSAVSVNYTGSAATTDRLWLLGGTGSSTINNNGSGAISFTNTGNMASGTAGARSLTLGGSYTAAANTFAERLTDLGTGTAITTLKVGGNTWNITGNNSHSGGTTLNSSGLINIGHSNALGTGTFTIGGNGSFDNTTGSDLTITNALALSGGSPTYAGSANNMTINGAVALSGANRSLTVTSKTLTLGGAIGEDISGRSFTKAGSGTLVFAASSGSTYSGGTIISGGTLAITAANNLGTGNSITLNTSNTSTLALAAGASGTVQIPASTTITTTTITGNFGNQASNSTVFDIAAKITGTGNVNRSSGGVSTTGAVRFSNDTNDYSGTFNTGFGLTEFTSVANAGIASSLGAGTGSYAIGNGSSSATLRYVGSGNTSTNRSIDWKGDTGGLSIENNGSGTIGFLGTSAFVSGNGNKTLSLSGSNTGANTLAQPIGDGPVSGVTGLTKSGTGKWILGGTSTYTGTTTVSAGTLLVNGSLGDTAVTVNSNATLGGSGTIGTNSVTNTLTVNGTLSPGNSPGVLTINDNLSLNGSLAMEIAGLTAGNGTGFHDQIVLNGAGILGGTLNLSWNLSSAAPLNTELLLILNDGADPFSGAFSNAADLSQVTDNLGKTWKLLYAGGSGNDLTLVAVPEPDPAALLGALGALALLRRRR